jgi:hypothetical protein
LDRATTSHHPQSNQSSGNKSEKKNGTLVTAIILGGIGFSISLWLAVNFYQLGIFQQYNVLFDTDPGCRLASLAHGWCQGSRNITHPNFSNFFNPPVRIAGLLAHHFLNDVNLEQVRVFIALLILPAASALQTSILFLTAGYLGFSRLQSILLSLLAIVTFTQLIYGSTPEHYGITSCVFAMAICLMAKLVTQQRSDLAYAWVGLQVLAIGITITSAVPLAILHFAALLGAKQRFWPSVWRTGGTAVIAVIITFSIAFAMNRLYEAPKADRDVEKFVDKYWAAEPIQRILEFPSALVNTFAPPRPSVAENIPAIGKGAPIKIRFTFANSPHSLSDWRPMGALVISFLIVGVSALFLAGGARGTVGAASLSIVFFNWTLHGFWGTELFLYASHWLVPAVMLMSGVFCIPRVPPRWINMAMAGFIAVILFVNIENISFILATVANLSS